MYGSFKFYLKAIDEGLKPIVGCEIYHARGSRLDKQKKMGDGGPMAQFDFDILQTSGLSRVTKDLLPQALISSVVNLAKGGVQKVTKEALADVPPGEYETLDAARLLVIPQPDNLVTLEFYGERQKFPGIKVSKWKLESARGLLKHVLDTDTVFLEVNGETVVKPADLALRCRVFYKLGKEYSYTDKQSGAKKTGHYKDVEHVRPL